MEQPYRQTHLAIFALSQFICCFSIVCQEAGRLRGLLPGELGRLGSTASIDREQLEILLPLVMSSLSKVELTLTTKKRVLWKGLDVTRQRHLELCSRLLACYQRLFLVEEEWKLLGDPNDFLARMTNELSRDKDDLMQLPQEHRYPVCPPGVLVKSPWIQLVLQPILESLPNSKIENMVVESAATLVPDQHAQNLNRDPMTNDKLHIFNHPLLDCINPSSNQNRVDSKILAPLLLLVSATAEAFPSGRCWTSSSQKNWNSMEPDDSIKDDIMHINGCSPNDFALLIHTITNVLEAVGGPTGDPEVQTLALLCLVRLTDAHGVIVACRRGKMSDVECAWRQVWSTLFRSDLRYAAYTANATEGSCGELVLILLTEMVHRWCTDPMMFFSDSASLKQSAFLYRNQSQLWLLPAFSKGTRPRPRHLFELVCIFLHRLALSDEGRDNIQDSTPLLAGEGSTDDASQRALGRRYRLLCLCLETLSSMDPMNMLANHRKLTEVISACIAALINCEVSLESRAFLDDSQCLSWARSSTEEGLYNKLCLTELPDATVCTVKRICTDSKSALFEKLWKSPIPDPGMSPLLQARLMESVTSDSVLAEKSKLCHTVRSLDMLSRHVDYAPPTLSTPLNELLRFQMKNLLERWSTEYAGGETAEIGPNAKQVDLEDAPLQLRCIWIKTALGSCLLSQEKDMTAPSFKFLQAGIVSLLQKVKSDLSYLCSDANAFHCVFLDVLHIILFFSEVSLSFRSLEIPAEVMKSFSSLVGVCESLLLSFSGAEGDQESWDENPGDDFASSSSESEHGQEDTNMANVLDDSDDDEVVNKRKTSWKKQTEKQQRNHDKRKATRPMAKNSGQGNMSPTRKKRRQNPSPPNSSCASIVGSLLVLLDPSNAKCIFVVDALLRRNEDDTGEVDLQQAYHCLSLLSAQSVIFHDNAKGNLAAAPNPLDESFRHQSPFSIIGEVLDSLQGTAPPSSALYFYGFRLCGDCVQTGESPLRGMDLTAEESKTLVDLINVEDAAILERPYLRLDQLRAATASFLGGKENFHSYMDPIFPKQFVIPSLQDQSSVIRKAACFAAGAALKILPNKERIVSTVLKKLPPIVRPTSTGEADTSYQEWYQHFELGSGDFAMESQLWEDSDMSMEYGALYCRSVVAGMDRDSTEKMLFELIRVAAVREDLEGACFCVCEKIACILGYTKVEDFLADESESILKAWVEEGYALAEIPLLLSSPGLLRLLLESGHQDRLYVDKKRPTDIQKETMNVLDKTNLKDVATDAFVGRYKSFLIPQVLMRFLSASAEEQKAGIVCDKYMQELSVCLKGDHSKETIKKIVIGRLHDIDALCAPMVHGNLAEPGRFILKVVSGLLQEEHGIGQNKSKPYLTVRRILELSGKDKTRVFPAHIVQEAFSEAISSLVDKLKSKKQGDILSAAGLSITECFLYARRWLDNATTPSQKERRWSTVSLLFDLIFAQLKRNDFKQSQIGFGINVVVDIALLPELRCLRTSALDLLKETLDKVFRSNADPALKEEVALVLRRLVGAVMKIHEECQQELVKYCRVAAKAKLRVFERGLGFLANHLDSSGIEEGTDPWGWDAATETTMRTRHSDVAFFENMLKDLQPHGGALPRDGGGIVDSIKRTYDILVGIFDKANVLSLGSDHYVGCMPPYAVSKSDQEALLSANPQFCAQYISRHFLKRLNAAQKEDLSSLIRSLLSELKHRISWMDSVSESPNTGSRDPVSGDDNGYSLSLSQWMLQHALVQLEHTLRRLRTEDEFEVSGEELLLLTKELSFVCGASCPDVLRSAASRCLGELDLQFVSKTPIVQSPRNHDWVQWALESNSLLRGIQAKAIQVLGEYLHSKHSGVAIAAMDTLIALFATHDGAECWELLDEQAQQNLLPVISSKKRSANINNLRLSKTQVIVLQSKNCIDLDSTTENSAWCWNHNLWRCSQTYEDWICSLVPSLIECCYRSETSSTTKGNFFSVCQLMSVIAPSFASALFPAITLDLLERSGNMVASPVAKSGLGTVLEDTWIGTADSSLNAKLSSSFEVMLGKSNPNIRNSRAVGLGIDTLDLLRRATQIRFLQSDGHKKNSSAVPNQPTSEKKQSKSSRGSKSPKYNAIVAAEYNKGLGEETAWRGLPFGTVLKIDGDLMVQACIHIKRCASALFYSDLFFESSFAGSGALMERLASDFTTGSSRAVLSSRTDISGYFMDPTPCEASKLRERAVESLQLLGECYLQLREEDAYQAVQRQSSDLKYNGCSIMSESEELTREIAPNLAALQRLDSLSNLPINPIETSIQSCDTMEYLGLRTFLQSYVSSMEWSKVEAMSIDERRMLREKWFQSRLYGMNWDKALLDCESGLSTGKGSYHKPLILGEAEIPREEMGFHEAITSALGAFARDDLPSCKGLSGIARTSLHTSVSSMASGESSLEELVTSVERLQSLNDIDRLADRSESPDDLLKQWGFFTLPEKENNSLSGQIKLKRTFASADFLPVMHEITLRLLRSKRGQDATMSVELLDPQECLNHYLWKFSSWCRETKHLATAEFALQRLRVAMRAMNDRAPASLEIALGLRLEDANLKETKGEFTTAIRLSKQTIAILKMEKQQRNGDASGIDCLLVDSLINCGGWLSRYKIEPARAILDSYHKPAASLAKSLYRRNESPENELRYLRSQIALARLASSLYDAVSARVKSLEWIKSGRSLADREQELSQCQTMLDEIKAKHTKATKAKSPKKVLARIAAEHGELVHYSKNLQNEILLSKRERTKTEQSLRDHLCLAMQAYVSVLSVAGAGHGGDMSRHVFRWISLWFSNCTEGKEDVEVNAIVDKAIGKIPTFRFIPLTSQIFAQLEEIGESPFQKTLQTLVQKMCTDHPYHCLVQLISVCNGKEVGSGVSGRNAKVFLENLSSSKVNAALEIANKLKRDAPTYVGELLDSYQILMNAYISLANFPTAELVQKGQIKGIALAHASKNHRLDKCLARRSQCPPCILTKPPPLRSGADYGDGVDDPIGGERIQGFDAKFSITDSGLHRPKIVICLGTKGGKFRQLVKGEDEIRQDAVMEQVFVYVNELMRRQDDGGARSKNKMNTNVSQKELRMVTYNIIALSPASGVRIAGPLLIYS